MRWRFFWAKSNDFGSLSPAASRRRNVPKIFPPEVRILRYPQFKKAEMRKEIEYISTPRVDVGNIFTGIQIMGVCNCEKVDWNSVDMA